MRKKVHQSYLFVALCAGIVIGIFLMVGMKWNFMLSPWWILVAVLLFIFAYIRPTYIFIVVALIAGMMIGFARSGGRMINSNSENTVDIWSGVVEVRDNFAANIAEALPETEAKLGTAYLLGIKSGLPKELDDNLKAAGLAHIVVASGTHLAILVEIIRKIFGKISRFAELLFSVLAIIIFMAMVGWTPSIMRAGIMSILTILMWYVGRKFAPWRIILIVMAVTLMIEPLFLTNLGWILSFASFGGIMILAPRIMKFMYGETRPKFIASTIITTVAATIATAPIVMYYFGSISLIAVLANLLFLPTLPYVMGLTFLTGIFGKVPIIGTGIGFVTEKMLDFHIAVVNFCGTQKMFIVEVPAGQPAIFLLYIPILLPFAIGLLREKMIKLGKFNINFGENMSGHSKWATTKRQKAVVDAKRGALFTKIGNQIAIAARSGTDPAMNPSLAMVLEKARLANMPKANIERAIARVADKSAATLIEETYEGYGPGGVGIIIEVATDNKNRTMPEVRHTLDKCGGRMADPGSVMFQFTRKGVIEISEKGEDALMTALDAGAEDAEETDDGIMIYTAAADLMKVRAALVEAGLNVTTAELQYVPNNFVPVEGDNAEKLEKLLDAIDELDDVTAVHTNAE